MQESIGQCLSDIQTQLHIDAGSLHVYLYDRNLVPLRWMGYAVLKVEGIKGKAPEACKVDGAIHSEQCTLTIELATVNNLWRQYSIKLRPLKAPVFPAKQH